MLICMLNIKIYYRSCVVLIPITYEMNDVMYIKPQFTAVYCVRKKLGIPSTHF